MDRVTGEHVAAEGRTATTAERATGTLTMDRAKPTGVYDQMAARTAVLLTSLGKLESGRTLLIEQRSPALALALRKRGFCGELVYLARRVTRPLCLAQGLFDRAVSQHWLSMLDMSDDDRALAMLDFGCFDVVMASNVLSLAPASRQLSALKWLRDLLAPRGFLILDESAQPINMHAIEQEMISLGLLMSADVTTRTSARSHTIAIAQYRGLEEAASVGILRKFTPADMLKEKPLFDALVAAYQAAFAGNEWREWVKCVRPGCGRHYSREEALMLSPSNRCACGWAEPLVPFYTAADVRKKLRSDLADPVRSCAYLRSDAGPEVTGFIWGHVSTPDSLVRRLVVSRYVAGRQALREQLRYLLARTGDDIGTGELYYQSEIGVMSSARSISLASGLLSRVLQFALDVGTNAFVTRTSREAGAYRLLLGLGLKVLYRYDMPDSSPLTDEDAMAESSQPGADQRVIMGGDIREVLTALYAHSHRQLVLHMARQLRQRLA